MSISSHVLSAGLLVSLSFGGCASNQITIPEPLAVAHQASSHDKGQEQPLAIKPSIVLGETPKPPEEYKAGSIQVSPAKTAGVGGERANITVAFEQMSLPNFIQAIYGVVLKKNYSMDPQIASRKDLVTLRASEKQTLSQIEMAARLLLKTYGVAVTDLDANNYRFTPDSGETGYAPEILRGRALPEVPQRLRPVYQLVELQAVGSAEVMTWLGNIFGKKVAIQNDSTRNALLLSGQSDEVSAVLEAIHILDQPLMKGRKSVSISPALWPVDEMAQKLTEILSAEGYLASTFPASTTNVNPPITLLPVHAINSIIVFAADDAILKHVVDWASQLDKPSANQGVSSGYFVYQVRYTNAELLAKTIQDLLGGSAVPPVNPGQAQVQGNQIPANQTQPNRGSRVVVNSATNSIIFQGAGESYTQILRLLQELDRPAKSALIEVSVVEVTLDDTTQMGVEWAFNASGAGGTSIVGGTRVGVPIGAGRTTTGLGVTTGGLTIARLNSLGDLRLLLNFLASSSKANILSSPRIMARNGETASIQVGSEIPTISQQQTNAATAGVGVLQSVQYRNTGVILKVKPIIYAGDRIDLDVVQEVSDSTRVGVASSPIIDTRKVDTHLSLKDGTPVLLGGIMSQNNTRTETGVPFLKDIPVVGQLFRNNVDAKRKTELLILITPYIVADDYDAQAVTDAFRRRLGGWAQPQLAH